VERRHLLASNRRRTSRRPRSSPNGFPATASASPWSPTAPPGSGICSAHTFPNGEQILDYYHCAEYVYATACAQYGEGTLEAQEWTEATLTRLCLNELGDVSGGLLRMTPRSPEAEEAIRTFSIFLAGQRDRAGYTDLRRRGLPRGSGGIESANKLICHVRLKRSGAWWLEANGNAMLRIRAIYNGTFDQIFADYVAAKGVTNSDP
jgi:hypothetical protein